MWLYIVDIVLQLFAFGLFRSKFIFLGRVIDTFLIVMFYYHLAYTKSIINITPLRMMRLLKQLGAIFEGIRNLLLRIVKDD